MPHGKSKLSNVWPYNCVTRIAFMFCLAAKASELVSKLVEMLLIQPSCQTDRFSCNYQGGHPYNLDNIIQCYPTEHFTV